MPLIDICYRCGGAANELHVPIVKLIDQRNEAPRRILSLCVEHRHIAEQHRVIATCQLDIVQLAARAFAQFGETEPHDIFVLALGMQLAVIDEQHRIRPAGLSCDIFEHCLQFAVHRIGVAVYQPGSRLAQDSQPIVGAAIDPQYFHMSLQVFDGGKKASPLQPVLVQTIGWNVRGRHYGDTALEHIFKKLSQQHCIGDV